MRGKRDHMFTRTDLHLLACLLFHRGCWWQTDRARYCRSRGACIAV